MWILWLKGLSACYCFLSIQRPGASQLNLLLSLCVRGHVSSVQTACVHLKDVLQTQGKPHERLLSLSNSSLSNLFYKVRRFLDGVFEIIVLRHNYTYKSNHGSIFLNLFL